MTATVTAVTTVSHTSRSNVPFDVLFSELVKNCFVLREKLVLRYTNNMLLVVYCVGKTTRKNHKKKHKKTRNIVKKQATMSSRGNSTTAGALLKITLLTRCTPPLNHSVSAD